MIDDVVIAFIGGVIIGMALRQWFIPLVQDVYWAAEDRAARYRRQPRVR